MSRAFKFKPGDRKDRWLILAYAGRGAKNHHYWRCICDCGTERTVTTNHITQTKSCGCYMRERNRRHGMCETRTYQSWVSMIRRCEDPGHDQHKNYGARGIAVCQKWRESFAAFYADMGERPPNTTIGRKDNDKGYEPGNCRWETIIEQSNNRRTSRFLTHNGKTMTVAEWARALGLPYKIMGSRLHLGWDIGRIVATPYSPRRAGDAKAVKE